MWKSRYQLKNTTDYVEEQIETNPRCLVSHVFVTSLLFLVRRSNDEITQVCAVKKCTAVFVYLFTLSHTHMHTYTHTHIHTQGTCQVEWFLLESE